MLPTLSGPAGFDEAGTAKDSIEPNMRSRGAKRRKKARVAAMLEKLPLPSCLRLRNQHHPVPLFLKFGAYQGCAGAIPEYTR